MAQRFHSTPLDQAGLNLQAVFDLAEFPSLAGDEAFRQLILIGHGGRRLWEAVEASGLASDHPIDDFTVRTLTDWFAAHYPDQRYRFLFPGEAPIGLQALGERAGWHHPSPFMVGIRPDWGSWFAYRAVVLADTDFPLTPRVEEASPCQRCVTRECFPACPGKALEGGFSLERCLHYRQEINSRCADTCQARLACPVGKEHRYEAAQMRHTYGRSLATIRLALQQGKLR